MVVRMNDKVHGGGLYRVAHVAATTGPGGTPPPAFKSSTTGPVMVTTVCDEYEPESSPSRVGVLLPLVNPLT